jgi:hypothetical protein
MQGEEAETTRDNTTQGQAKQDKAQAGLAWALPRCGWGI